MTSRSKAKGSAAERAVVDYLRAHGFPHAERRLAGHAQDRGDIAGAPGIVLEVKNHAQLRLADWVEEALLEQANDRADYGLVWHKRRGHTNAGAWYVTLTGEQAVRLLRQAGYGNPLDPAPEFFTSARTPHSAPGPASTPPSDQQLPDVPE